jgi:hypothetical protein
MVGWLVLMFNTTFNNILGAQKQTLKQTTLFYHYMIVNFPLLRNIMRMNPEQGLSFAQMLVEDEEPLADLNQVKQDFVYMSLQQRKLTIM